MDKDKLQEFMDANGTLKPRCQKYLKREVEFRDDSLQWRANPIKETCPDCGLEVLGRELQIKLNHGYKKKTVKKCTICRIDIAQKSL